MDSVMKSLPMVALRGLTIMPEMVVHFDVSRERSITAVQQAMMEDQKIFLVAQKSIETEDPGQEDVYSIGTVATVRQVIKLPKKIVRVLVSGEQRGRLTGISEKEPYLKAEVELLEETDFGIEDEIQRSKNWWTGIRENISCGKNSKLSDRSWGRIQVFLMQKSLKRRQQSLKHRKR